MYKDEIMMQYPNIPPLTVASLVNYVNHGMPPGGFLTAVLASNIFEAVNRADKNNQASLVDLVKMIWNHAPLLCHGNTEKMNVWMERRGMEQFD